MDTDVVVIGGGVMGSSVAFHLVSMDRGISVLVAERDATYRRASSALSVGNIRVQFSLKENVLISAYGLSTFADFWQTMAVDGEPADIAFHPDGNVFLVSAAEEDDARMAMKRQRSFGCDVTWMSAPALKDRFPCLRCDAFAGATFGAGDGRVDGYGVVMAYRRKSRALGAVWLEDRVIGIRTEQGAVTRVQLAKHGSVRCGAVVNCAGAWAAEVAAMAGIDLPVTPVRRQVYTFETSERSVSFPLVVAPDGLYFRTESTGQILTGKSFDDDPVTTQLVWDESGFSQRIWPELARLVPHFDAMRNLRGWAGLYAVNQLDGNAILGPWPTCRGFFLANGFSGHGLQQAPAVGRYLAESILGRPHALDLDLFAPTRILEGRPISERCLV